MPKRLKKPPAPKLTNGFVQRYMKAVLKKRDGDARSILVATAQSGGSKKEARRALQYIDLMDLHERVIREVDRPELWKLIHGAVNANTADRMELEIVARQYGELGAQAALAVKYLKRLREWKP